jgi:hypothetical protein
MKSILDFADTEKELDWNGWFDRCDEREELTGLETFKVEYLEDGEDENDIWWKTEVALTEEETRLMQNYENENYLVQFLLKSTLCRLLKNSEIIRLRLV